MASPGGTHLILSLFEECRAIAEGAGHAPRAPSLEQARATLTTAGSTLTASMLRDVEANTPIEADHVVGDLLRRNPTNRERSESSPLATAYTHMKAYEARRARALAAASATSPRP